MTCVCFIGSYDTFKLLGNKATSSDIEFRHSKSGVSFVTPLNDKAKTLIQAVNLSDYVIIEVNEINKYLGEVVILLQLLNKKGRFIVSRINQSLITSIKGLGLNYEVDIINDNSDIKKLRDYVSNIKPLFGSEPLIIIDHFFTVKSVGTVALGFVKGGTIKAKDKFRLLPLGKDVQINSLQSMDVNYKEVSKPLRVGLALKNCSVNDLERGSVLSKVLEQVSQVKGEIIKSRFHKSELKKFMIINGLLVREAAIINREVRVNKPIVITGDTIIYDENSSPRIIGIIKY